MARAFSLTTLFTKLSNSPNTASAHSQPGQSAHTHAGPRPGSLMPLPVSWSVVTAAVRPTPDEPRPVVGMALGAVQSTYRRSWDLATEGSPTEQGSGEPRGKSPHTPAYSVSAAHFLAKSHSNLMLLLSFFPQGSFLKTSILAFCTLMELKYDQL